MDYIPEIVLEFFSWSFLRQRKPWSHNPSLLNGRLENCKIGGRKEIRQPFANPSPTLCQPFANPSPTFRQPFANLFCQPLSNPLFPWTPGIGGYRSIQNYYRQTSILRAINFQLQIQNPAARRVNFHYRNRSVGIAAENLSLQIQILSWIPINFHYRHRFQAQNELIICIHFGYYGNGFLG